MLDEHGKVQPNEPQRMVLGAPYLYVDPDDNKLYPMDCTMLTGRGWSKSSGALLKIAQYIRDFPGSDVMCFRQTGKSLKPLKKLAQVIFAAEDSNVVYNKQEGLFTFANDSTVGFDMLSCYAEYQSHQGANYQILFFDEIQQWADPELADLMLGTLRGGEKDQPCFAIYAGNCGDKGHFWVTDRWLSQKRFSGQTFRAANSRPCVIYQGSYRDNVMKKGSVNLNGEQYAQTLKETTTDPALLAMWLSGRFDIAGGCYFSNSLSRDNMVNWFPVDYWYNKGDWKKFISMDHGTVAPCVVHLMAEATTTTRGPDDEVYRKGDLVCVAEMSTALHNAKNKGDGSSIAEICDRTLELIDDWKWSKYGVGDDAIFSDHGGASTLAQEYEKHGLYIKPAGKGKRIPGWDILKLKLSCAVPNGQRHEAKPALYINERACPYTVATMKVITGDPRNLGDVDSASFDHACDSIRYSVVSRASQEPPVERLDFFR